MNDTITHPYFEGDGVAFGDRGHYYKWIVSFYQLPDGRCSNFEFEQIGKEEFFAHPELHDGDYGQTQNQ
jgi:hypothetical protein